MYIQYRVSIIRHLLVLYFLRDALALSFVSAHRGPSFDFPVGRMSVVQQ